MRLSFSFHSLIGEALKYRDATVRALDTEGCFSQISFHFTENCLNNCDCVEEDSLFFALHGSVDELRKLLQ